MAEPEIVGGNATPELLNAPCIVDFKLWVWRFKSYCSDRKASSV